MPRQKRTKKEPSDVQPQKKDGEVEDISENANSMPALSELKVQELREELVKRGIDPSGRKADLIAKLNTATLNDPKVGDKKIQDDSDTVVGKKRKQPSSEREGDKKEDACEQEDTKNINKMTVDALKNELSSRGLSTSGTKKTLVQRLEAAMKDTSSVVKDEASQQDGSVDNVKEEKIVTVTKKGGAVLDSWLPDDIKSQYHVLVIAGTAYDAMLNQTNVGENNNKFYVIQVLESDAGGEYMVYNRWGRVGVKGQDKLFGPFASAHDAVTEFETKFYDKTKNLWSERHNFTSYPKKYTWLEMDYAEDNLDKDKKVNSKTESSVGTNLPKQSKLDTHVAELISLICNVTMMTQHMMELGYNANKLPLGKLSKSTIMKGYDVLKRISIALEHQDRKNLEQLSSEFYTVIPHDFGFKKMREFIIDTPVKLKRKLEMVESLGEIELATKLLEDGSEEKDDPLFAHYMRLGCQIFPLEEDSQEVQLIKRFMNNTHAKTHANYTLEALQIFKVSRDSENDRFQKFSTTNNRMLLWHGSRLTNWMGILSQGLRIAPPEAPVNGYMFGKGVYFADMVSKSANYCYTNKSSPIGVLLLCEVALGDMVELTQANYSADKLPSGKLSTKGVGKTAPDPSEFYTLPDGVVIPMGKPTTQSNQGVLLYNEFIVYNVEQIRMRYLLEVKFNYKY